MNSNGGLLRIDDTGELLWSRSYPHDGDQELHDIAARPNGDLVVTGYTTEQGLTYRSFVLQTAANGEPKHYKILGDGGFDLLDKVVITDDGGLKGATQLNGKDQRVTVASVGVPRNYTLATWIRVDADQKTAAQLIGVHEKGAGQAWLQYG